MVGLRAVSVLLSVWAAAAPADGARAPIAVESDTDCPAATDVASRLAPLLPAATAEGYRLLLSTMQNVEPPQLRLVLADPRGRVVVERPWPLRGECAVVAEEIAVLAAAWVGELPPSQETDLGLPAPDVTVDPPAVARSPAAAVVAPAAPALPGPARDLGGVISLGAGISSPFATWVAPALSLEALLRRTGDDSPYAGIAFSGNLPRTENGEYWYRVRVAAEAGYAWHWGRHGAALGGGLGGGVLRSKDSGVDHEYTYGDFSVFGQARYTERLGSQPSAWDGWLALRFTRALMFNNGSTGSSTRSPQSRDDFALTAGVDFSLGD